MRVCYHLLVIIICYGGKVKSTNLSWVRVGLGWDGLEFDKIVVFQNRKKDFEASSNHFPPRVLIGTLIQRMPSNRIVHMQTIEYTGCDRAGASLSSTVSQRLAGSSEFI